MFDEKLITRARTIISAAQKQGLIVSTAESCTGGLVSAVLTEIPGSSQIFQRGYVVYANDAKEQMLGVSTNVLTRVGAVSEECAEAMALGALQASGADLAVAVTGIAGPDGGTVEKPIGLVCFALARKDRPTRVTRKLFKVEGRSAIRRAAVETALSMLEESLLPQLMAQ